MNTSNKRKIGRSRNNTTKNLFVLLDKHKDIITRTHETDSIIKKIPIVFGTKYEAGLYAKTYAIGAPIARVRLFIEKIYINKPRGSQT